MSSAYARTAARRAEGLTLLETVIAIVIGLVILAGIGVLVYKATRTNKVAQAYSDMATIAANMRNLYSGTNQTPTTSVSTYINAGVFPETMISGSTLVDPWGGSVAIVYHNTTSLWVGMNSVPKSACIGLSQKLPDIGSQSIVNINSHSLISPTLSTATTYCDSSTNSVSILLQVISG